jgi:hypothetical protein
VSIIRAPRPEAGYYALDRKLAEDDRLSWAARGLLVFLLVKPDHWRVSIEHLRRQTEAARVATGRDGVYSLLGELEDAGYVQRRQSRGQDGRLAPVEYLVAEAPLPAQPDTAAPLPAPPYTAETTLDKTQTADKNQGITSTRERAKRAPDAQVDLPEWVPADAWAAWLEVRRKLRAPNTARALELAISSLDQLRTNGHHPREVLEQSTARGWRGLFPIKSPQPGSQQHDHDPFARRRGESSADHAARINRIHDERERAGHH